MNMRSIDVGSPRRFALPFLTACRPGRARRLAEPRGWSAGFTLLELLTVMVIMFMIMGVGVGSFLGYTRGAAIRGAVANVKGTLQLARQHAMSYQRATGVIFEPREPLNEGGRTLTKMYVAVMQIGRCADVVGSRVYLHNPVAWGDNELEGATLYNMDSGQMVGVQMLSPARPYVNRNYHDDPGLVTPHWVLVDGPGINAGARVGVAIQARRLLPDGIVFRPPVPPTVFFNPNGTSTGGDVEVRLGEAVPGGGAQVSLVVRGLTGWVEEVNP